MIMWDYKIIWRKSKYIQPWGSFDYAEIWVEAMKKTWQFVQEYIYRFLAKPKAKHDFTVDQYVLREKEKSIQSESKYKELFQIIEDFSKKDFLCRRNNIGGQSVPLLVHYHIATFKEIDQKILDFVLE